jgi:peptide deformylase
VGGIFRPLSLLFLFCREKPMGCGFPAGGSGVTVMKVVEWPAKILETRADEVKVFDAEFQAFVDDMFETMRESSGIGLAANQVGSSKRVFVVNIAFCEKSDEVRKPWHDRALTFVNPEITRREGKLKYQEGCLSFPDVYEYVERAAEVWVKAQDEKGEPFELHADELMAVCIQHELDHLDGIPFFKRMSRLKSALVKKKMMRYALTMLEDTAAEGHA